MKSRIVLAAVLAVFTSSLTLSSHPADASGRSSGIFHLARNRHDPPQETAAPDHFKLAYDPSLESSVTDYRLWLESARRRVQETLGFLPIFPVPAALCSTPEQYRRAGGIGDPLTGSVVRDRMILLADPQRPQKAAVNLERLYIRFAVGQLTAHRAAPWLVDGVALSQTVPFTAALPSIAEAVRQDKLTPLPPGALETDLSSPSGLEHTTAQEPGTHGNSPDDLPLPEAEAVFALFYLENVKSSTHPEVVSGLKGLPKLLQEIGDGQTWSHALQDVASLDAAGFQAGWMHLARSGVRAFVPPGEHTGTWSSKARAPGVTGPPLPGHAARIRLVIGDYVLQPTDQVDALLVAGGSVTIRGAVTARIGVVGGSLHLAQSAQVRGHISVLGGGITVDPGAVVQATCEVNTAMWNPSDIHSSRANLEVTLDHPAEVDLRLPGQSFWLKEGSIQVPENEKLDAALAIGGSVTVLGSVTSRAVAIGGDVKLPRPPLEGMGMTTLGGRIFIEGKALPPETEPDSVTQIISFVQDFAAPVQPGPDPVPVFIGVGDCAIPRSATYDAILCVGGSVIVNGTVRGGLVVGGDTNAASGSTLTGPLWGFGGHVRTQPGANIKGLEVLGEAGQTKPR